MVEKARCVEVRYGALMQTPLTRVCVRQGSIPCTPEGDFRVSLTLTTRACRPLTLRKAFRLCTPDQPFAGWMPPRSLASWNSRRRFRPSAQTGEALPLRTSRGASSALRDARLAWQP